jgi:acylphosphatase
MTVRLVVKGKVQGVGFRFFTLRRAIELGLDGFVRNLPDGSVEIVARGPGARLETLEAAVKAGPRSARVTEVEKSEISDEMTIGKGFTVN